MKENMEEPQDNVSGNEELGNYITQVVTDIGSSCISPDTVNKLSKVSQSLVKVGEKKEGWKMASVTNQSGVPPAEYSTFTLNVYRHLSYLKDVDAPELEELEETNRMVNIEPRKENSKSYY